MSLPLLGLLVIGGIGGITILLHLLGLSRPRQLAADDEARIAWRREFPEVAAGAVLLNSGRNAALIESELGPGLVWVMGQDTTARLLTGARIRQTARGLDIRLPDPGAPRLRLQMSAEDARDWLERIEEEKWRRI